MVTWPELASSHSPWCFKKEKKNPIQHNGMDGRWFDGHASTVVGNMGKLTSWHRGGAGGEDAQGKFWHFV